MLFCKRELDYDSVRLKDWNKALRGRFYFQFHCPLEGKPCEVRRAAAVNPGLSTGG